MPNPAAATTRRTYAAVAAERRTVAALVASAVRKRDRAAEARLRAQHADLLLEAHILKAVEAAPPLSDTAREHLAALLRTAGKP